MTEPRIIQIVAQALSENHPWRVEPAVRSDSGFEELRVDDVDKLSIRDRVEHEFNIEIRDAALKLWGSVADIVAMVERRTEGVVA